MSLAALLLIIQVRKAGPLKHVSSPLIVFASVCHNHLDLFRDSLDHFLNQPPIFTGKKSPPTFQPQFS